MKLLFLLVQELSLESIDCSVNKQSLLLNHVGPATATRRASVLERGIVSLGNILDRGCIVEETHLLLLNTTC